MIPAPSIADISTHYSKYPGALCCILFAPLFSETARKGIIPRLEYLNERTADNINFYCAGYGKYWQRSDFPDMEEVNNDKSQQGKKSPWIFSNSIFAKFIDEMEKSSNWKYGGESELIVLNNINSFKDCLILNIDQMINDKAIDRCSEIFESLIQYSRNGSRQTTTSNYSNRELPGIFGKAVLAAITQGPNGLGKTLAAGKHFAIKDISR